MSSYIFVQSAEIPFFILQVNVFIVSVKLACENGRYKGFYVLYTLQNLIEIVSYISLSFTTRFTLMGVIQPSDLDNTYGECMQMVTRFAMNLQPPLHLAAALERSSAITNPETHKKVRQWPYLWLAISISLVSSLVCVALFAVDVTLVIKAGESIRMVPRDPGMHTVNMAYVLGSKVVCLVFATLLEIRGFLDSRRQLKDPKKRYARTDYELLVFTITRTVCLTVPLTFFVVSIAQHIITHQPFRLDLHAYMYSYVFGLLQLSGALVLVVKSSIIRNEVFRFYCRRVGTTQVTPISNESGKTNSLQPPPEES